MSGQRHAPAALPPGNTRYPLYRRLSGSHGRSGRVRKISPPSGFDPRTVQPVASRYTDCAIPAPHLHLAPRLKKEWSYTAAPPLDLRGLLQGELYRFVPYCSLLIVNSYKFELRYAVWCLRLWVSSYSLRVDQSLHVRRVKTCKFALVAVCLGANVRCCTAHTARSSVTLSLSILEDCSWTWRGKEWRVGVTRIQGSTSRVYM